ncbi:hypothetical protein [Paenibacillus pinistramenti]|uniref:hypothetical protein n=1 Tax=Paenibacillus pinistramenti TaxID=1768003 RepID=UPI001EEFFE3F|nr:hypothetical protein [Paenibacillus pinistramenti]
MNGEKDKELEEKLSELLTEGVMEDGAEADRQEEGRRRLSPKYEVRIQTTFDPVVEETLKYRSMAKEIDGRYDKYVNDKYVNDKYVNDKYVNDKYVNPSGTKRPDGQNTDENR